MKLIIDKVAKFIIDELQTNGFDAFIVGGCVRDLIIGRVPKDYDITTNAKPSEIMDVFNRYKTILTGVKYGTVTVVICNKHFEITTYRSEGEYLKNRKPKEVVFLDSIQEDLSRRDFTINAMAYNEKDGIVDLFGGVNDLKNKVIRVVGDGNKRFEEDAIRILRAYRFAGRYNFKIDETTCKAIKNNVHLLNNIAKERIVVELREIFESGMDIYEMEFIQTLFPIIKECFGIFQNNKYHMTTVGDHIYHTFNNIENKFHLKLTMLLHDIGKVKTKTTDNRNIDHFYNHSEISREIAKNILEEFKFDNCTKNKVLLLIENHDKYITDEKRYVKEKLNELGEDLFFDLIKVRIADDLAKNQSLVKDNLKVFKAAGKCAEEIIKNNEPYKISQLNINGNDILNLGCENRQVGNILKYLLLKVIENKDLNKKEILLDLVIEYIKRPCC